jgi:serine/threonine-protein kinase HipA
MPDTALAGVYLEDRRVGTLGYADGNTWFEYEDREPSHPVLGQAFEIDPNRRRSASGSVPEWFANLLPESESGLRSLIGQELGRSNPHDFQLITFLGEDLPGAVRVISESNLAEIPELSKRTESSVDHQIRFSLAGVQEKFSMRWQGKGLTLPMSGQGGDWIVKLPDRRFAEVPANEYTMLYWATLCGITVPRVGLFYGSQLSGLPAGMIGDDELAFGIERFDRSGDRRIHQEDFAQVREVSPQLKYERANYGGLARFINRVCPKDLEEYIRRLVAMVVMGNLDAHLKNWTIQYPDRRQARLSPAYDLVCVSVYPEFRSQRLAFAIDGGTIADGITLENFRRLSHRANLEWDSVSETVRKTTNALIETWPQAKTDSPVPAFIENHIEQRLQQLPLIYMK